VILSLQEVKSLCSQLSFTYATNRRSRTPFASLLFTDLHGRALNRLESLENGAYKRWKSCEWWTEGLEELWSPSSLAEEGAALPDAQASDSAAPSEAENLPARPPARSSAPKNKVVYLTADSTEEILELSPDETYVIGGIVDRNRYKVHFAV